MSAECQGLITALWALSAVEILVFAGLLALMVQRMSAVPRGAVAYSALKSEIERVRLAPSVYRCPAMTADDALLRVMPLASLVHEDGGDCSPETAERCWQAPSTAGGTPMLIRAST
jgi:hypothetical protein